MVCVDDLRIELGTLKGFALRSWLFFQTLDLEHGAPKQLRLTSV